MHTRVHTIHFSECDVRRYCPPNACDHYSNPNLQEILKLAPHPEWGPHGFPTGPPVSPFTHQRTSWTLNVGALTARLGLAGIEPAVREWTTLNIGPEMVLDGSTAALNAWDIGDFDVLVPRAALTRKGGV